MGISDHFAVGIDQPCAIPHQIIAVAHTPGKGIGNGDDAVQIIVDSCGCAQAVCHLGAVTGRVVAVSNRFAIDQIFKHLKAEKTTL